MKYLQKVVILTSIILSILICQSAFAGERIDQRGAKIITVYINLNGLMLMKITDGPGWLSIGTAGNPTADAMYSAALAAKLSGQSNLWIRYVIQESGYPTVSIISIE